MRRLKLLAVLLVAGAASTAALAEVSDNILSQRAQQLVGFWNGEVGPEEVYSRDFIARAEAQGLNWKEDVETFKGEFGKGTIKLVNRTGPYSADIMVQYERALMKFEIGFQQEEPHLISSGRLVGGSN